MIWETLTLRYSRGVWQTPGLVESKNLYENDTIGGCSFSSFLQGYKLDAHAYLDEKRGRGGWQ